ncbi:uncharacterized protein LOC129944702 isoform X2 [Eupeodes corollae]|uniref:uncharacterized protein LOC129944702 isoform X2 n=1 Tax=Eupeodes corollae TaxID=290404 RepID=UPI00248FFE07|nr:uncharacterized protein LOC129944702 isoform X2 [Eupeodes corollae]
MVKKFVALNNEVEPSQTPYNIKTFKASEDTPRHVIINPCPKGTPSPELCQSYGKKTVTRPITIEEAIFHWFENPKKSTKFPTSVKKKCQEFDPYTNCVMNQRSPGTLKEHAILREKYLKLQTDTKEKQLIHDVSSSNGASLIEMESLMTREGEPKPKLASPACSVETFYVPSRRLLDLKRPRSGVFVNETPRLQGIDIPYESYNPRKLQEKLESENRQKYKLFADGDRLYFPWMKEQEEVGDINRNQLNDIYDGYINFKPVIFPIPSDLEKTFKAAAVFGNGAVSIAYEPNIRPRRPVEIACLYAAYVESFSKNPDFWDAKTIDSIIQSGMILFKKSLDRNYTSPSSDFDIIPELTEKEAAIEMKLHLTATLTEEPNILKALTLFFDKFQAGILYVENLFFLIWKRCIDSFYIFDPNGRDLDCKRNLSEEGKASLIIIQTIEHIVHLILNYSEVEDTTDFNLYEIHLTNFGKLAKPLQLEEITPPKKAFAVVNRFYAIIPALSGLPIMSEGRAFDDNASLMTSYLGLIYSQIDPPREWTVQVIDDLIKFGKKYHSEYICDNRLKQINIADLPEVLLFGNYRVLVDKKAFVQSGHVVECKSYRSSQLIPALKEFFKTNSFGLIQIDFSTFGLWREGDKFFVFDPFKRGPAGQAETLSKSGMGCLQIHLNFNSLCRITYINAISIKTQGNFFLHGIRVKAVGTFNINRALKDAAGFGILQIRYPFECEATPKKEEENEKVPNPDSLNCLIVQCLSQLSLHPCERTCSEHDFIQAQKKMALRTKIAESHSITSIPEQFRIPEYDNVDIVDFAVGEFIQDLMDNIQKATEKRPKVCLEASKILLQSDMSNLEDLKMKLKRGEDYDNYCSAFQSKETVIRQITLEEELAQESNFKSLPDGSWAIFGRQTDLYISSGSLKGILSTLNAAVLTSKYKISTWNSDVIDYALEGSAVLKERFWSYNHTLDLIFRNQIPKIQIGKTTFDIKITSTKSIASDDLSTNLRSTLLRVIIICKGLSCLVLKRYNLIYMFMGCSCDVVGFRSQAAGPICLLRFLEINALIRRIEDACGPCQKYVLVEFEVRNITDPKVPRKFVPRTESQEEVLYDRELNEKDRQKQRYNEKMKFLESEIKKESKRVDRFAKEKQSPRMKKGNKISKKLPEQRSISNTSDFVVEFEEEGEMEEESSEKSIEFKHIPRDVKPRSTEAQEQQLPPKHSLGYQLRDVDCLFKIQGSTGLENRLEDSQDDKIKTCYFASSIALLYAILRPLNHWDSLRIDKVIGLAKNVAKTTTDLSSNVYTERILKNIDADEFIFEVKVYAYAPPGTFGGDLIFILDKALKTQRYILLQISNATFTVYSDKYFHLFDPYQSMEVASEEDAGDESQQRCPKSIKKYPEQNTASWILFGDLNSMLDYIDKRTTSQDWKTEYKLHAVSVVSYKTAPKRKQLLNILTDGLDATCQETIRKTDNICTHPEEIEWLDIYPNLVLWSRLNRSNSVNRIRGSPMTKDKNFDIEIPEKLYSLWGSIHPMSSVFGESRGKQHLAINVIACCVSSVYRVSDWNTQVIDSIVINGNDYYNESISEITRKDYEISLEHLNTFFQMGHLYFEIHLESVLYGYLYSKAKHELNLGAALGHFFTQNQYGIIQCMKHSLAIGKIDSGYFMFECQSQGMPLFPSGEGAAYVLRTSLLQDLLYCIIMTFNNSFYNSQFTIHKVEVLKDKKEDQGEEEGEGEEEF